MDQLVAKSRKVTLHGREFIVDGAHDAFWDLAAAGQWEPYTFDIMDQLLTKDTVYIDLGAWIGPTVLYASRLAKECYAIEPDPIAYRWLGENISLNQISNVTALNIAILDYNGTTTLGAEELGSSMTRLNHIDNAFLVKCSTLDILSVTEVLNDDPLFIKMDVEGAEELILRDIDFFKLYRPTLYLSLHPQWFRDQVTAMETVRRISRLYLHQHDLNGTTMLFTDRVL